MNLNELKFKVSDATHQVKSSADSFKFGITIEQANQLLHERLEKMFNLDELVNRFLAWPLPTSVCSDLCATVKDYPHRSGTALLTADEARQMLKYILANSSDKDLKE